MDGLSLRFVPSTELTIYQVEEVSKKLAGTFGGAQNVLIDLERTNKIDTAGFQLLVSLIKSCKTSGKECVLEGMSGSVDNFMALFGYEWNAGHRGKI